MPDRTSTMIVTRFPVRPSRSSGSGKSAGGGGAMSVFTRGKRTGGSLLSEIRLADGVAGPQLGRRPLDHHPARLDDVGPVGPLQRLGGVLLDEQDRRPLPVDLGDGVEDLG